MTKIRFSLAASSLAIALGACTTTPAGTAPVAMAPAPAKPAKLDRVDASLPTQLPRGAVPSHYAITLTPDAANLAFTGKVATDLMIDTATDSLTLNAVDLKLSSASIVASNGARHAAAILPDPKNQAVRLAFATILAPGAYTLDIDYSGKINEQANGLFALDYKDVDNKDARALFTQFEPADARRFFPGWDEPDYKASFDLSAIVPEKQLAVSNMPVASETALGDGTKRVVFQTSPEMSSYLLFFGVGDLERITKMAGDTEVGVVASRGNVEKGRTALEAQAQILPYYNDYFGVKYPLPKLDNIAGPGQSQFFSAMENWGAIFTFERVLLDDPAVTTQAEREAIFGVDAHEMAHQWFGDLVTMGWWGDLWLNEGFASWMATKATEHFHPEWGSGFELIQAREAAMSQDSLKTTHPVVQDVRTVEQANQAFDNITYSKGQAVISMLEDYAGGDTWRAGIRDYMKAHQYNNTKSDDLWGAVEAQGARGLTAIAHQFTLQPGVPLVTVGASRCVGGKTEVNLTQGEFALDRPLGSFAAQGWSIPVKLNAGGETVTVMTSGKDTLASVPGCGTLLVNAGQKGYYRTLYPASAIPQIAATMGKWSSVDQYGLLADQINLGNAGYQNSGKALDLVAAVAPSADPRIQQLALASWLGLYNISKDNKPLQAKVRAEIERRFAPQLDRIGLAGKPNDDAVTTSYRPALIGALGAVGDPRIKAEAVRLFDALQTDPNAIQPSLRNTWLSQVAGTADEATWNRIHDLAKATTNATQRQNYYRLLSSTTDEALAKKALALALTDEPGKTVSAGMIAAVAAKHPELALDFILANKAKVTKLIDLSSQSRFVARLAAGSNDPATIAKLDAYAKANLSAADRGPIDATIALIKLREVRTAAVRAEALAWLRARFG